MKVSELRKLIRKEIKKVIMEQQDNNSIEMDKYIRSIKDRIFPDSIRFKMSFHGNIDEYHFTEVKVVSKIWYIYIESKSKSRQAFTYDPVDDAVGVNGYSMERASASVSRNAADAVFSFIKTVNPNSKVTLNDFNLLR